MSTTAETDKMGKDTSHVAYIKYMVRLQNITQQIKIEC